MQAPRIHLNVLANLGGQAWRALMAMVFVPFYLRILGVEAYGLIGLYASLQMTMALLDSGLRPTLAREMARFTGGAMDAFEIRTLLRSVELPLFGMALVIMTILVISSPWMAIHWVHAQTIPAPVVARAFAIMGAVAAAQFIESIYDSCLNGLQRQVVQNVIITAIATLRGAGVLLILWLVPTVTAFFVWQALVSVISLLCLSAAVYQALPRTDEPVGFSLEALNRVRAYAAGMLGIALISLLLTQSDKLLVARLLPLSALGSYALAGAVASTLSVLSGPIGNAFQPRLTQLIAMDKTAEMASAYRQATRLMVVVVGSAATVMVMFGERLLNLWIGNPQLSAATAPVMALLTLGWLFNSLTAMPYRLQLSHGLTGLTLRINIASLIIFMPCLVVLIKHYGAVGGGVCWMGLNLGFFLIGSFLTFRKYLAGEQRGLWLHDLGFLLAVIFAAGLLARALLPHFHNRAGELGSLIGAGVAIMAAGIVVDAPSRTMVLGILRRAFRYPYEEPSIDPTD